MHADQPATPKQKLRWFHLTPGRLLVLLLAVEAVLLLSERFHWFPFNEHKGWTVLIALAAVGVFLLFMLIWFVFALLFRRHFQFSIRSLLVLTIAVALPFSWLAVKLKWAREQKEAVEAITQDGGEVQYDDEGDFSPPPPETLVWIREQLGHDFFNNVLSCLYGSKNVTDTGLERLKGLTPLNYLELRGTRVTDAVLAHLTSMTQLRGLYLNNTQITGTGLDHLKGLTQLIFLELNGSKFTDAGLEHLKSLTQIKLLLLSHTEVTDIGLEHLKSLAQIEWLKLNSSKFTDAGLYHLKGLTQLQTLDLRNTTVTDAGLEHLKGLTQLQRLFLSDTKVTAAGIAKLQKALPKLQIQR